MFHRDSKGKEPEPKSEPFRREWPEGQRPLLYKHKYRSLKKSGDKTRQEGESSKKNSESRQYSGHADHVGSGQDNLGSRAPSESQSPSRTKPGSVPRINPVQATSVSGGNGGYIPCMGAVYPDSDDEMRGTLGVTIGATVGPVSPAEQARRDKQRARLNRAGGKSSSESVLGPEVKQDELW